MTYNYHQLRWNMPADLLRDITEVHPEHTVWLHGVEYVRIYRVDDLPEAIYTPDPWKTPKELVHEYNSTSS